MANEDFQVIAVIRGQNHDPPNARDLCVKNALSDFDFRRNRREEEMKIRAGFSLEFEWGPNFK